MLRPAPVLGDAADRKPASGGLRLAAEIMPSGEDADMNHRLRYASAMRSL
jgi:hypothetical protein